MTTATEVKKPPLLSVAVSQQIEVNSVLERLEALAKIVCSYYRIPTERIKGNRASGRALEAKRMFIFMTHTSQHLIPITAVGRFLKAEGDFYATLNHHIKRVREIKCHDEQMRDDIHAIQEMVDEWLTSLPVLVKTDFNSFSPDARPVRPKETLLIISSELKKIFDISDFSIYDGFRSTHIRYIYFYLACSFTNLSQATILEFVGLSRAYSVSIGKSKAADWIKLPHTNPKFTTLWNQFKENAPEYLIP